MQQSIRNPTYNSESYLKHEKLKLKNIYTYKSIESSKIISASTNLNPRSVDDLGRFETTTVDDDLTIIVRSKLDCGREGFQDVSHHATHHQRIPTLSHRINLEKHTYIWYIYILYLCIVSMIYLHSCMSSCDIHVSIITILCVYIYTRFSFMGYHRTYQLAKKKKKKSRENKYLKKLMTHPKNLIRLTNCNFFFFFF